MVGLTFGCFRVCGFGIPELYAFSPRVVGYQLVINLSIFVRVAIREWIPYLFVE